MIYRRLYGITLIAICMTMLSGCWSSKELNTISIVSGITLDKAKDGIRLSFEIYKPQNQSGTGQGESEAKSIITYSEGELNLQTIREVPKHVNRRLFLPHAIVLLIGEELLENNIMDYLDFWIRENEAREKIKLVIVKGSKAYKALEVNTGLEDTSAQYINSLLENKKSNSETKSVSLVDFLADYYDDGIENVLPFIEIINDGEKEILLLNGIGIIKNESLVGYLEGIEVRAYNFVTNNIDSAIIVTETPNVEGAKSAVEVLSSKCKIKYIKGKMEFKVKINIAAMLSEQTKAVNLKKAEIIDQIEQSCANTVKSQIEEVIKKTQKQFKADIFGFGQVLHRQSPKEWKILKDNWQEYYPDAKIDVSVNVKIQRRGMTNSSAKWKDDK